MKLINIKSVVTSMGENVECDPRWIHRNLKIHNYSTSSENINIQYSVLIHLCMLKIFLTNRNAIKSLNI